MKDRLVEVVDEVVITGQNADEKMCSCESDVVDETCSSESYGACRVRDTAPKEKYLKLLEFRHFERHILFSQSDRKEKKKAISNGVNVQVVVKV